MQLSPSLLPSPLIYSSRCPSGRGRFFSPPPGLSDHLPKRSFCRPAGRKNGIRAAFFLLLLPNPILFYRRTPVGFCFFIFVC